MDLYHGTRKNFATYPGICFTDSIDSACRYAGVARDFEQGSWHIYGSGEVATVHLDFTDLTVEEIPGYDRETNTAYGDDPVELASLESRGVDVVVYEDEDEGGQMHRCWRLISGKALTSVMIVVVEREEEEEL